MSKDHLFQDPLGEVDHVADLMCSVEGAKRGDRDAIIYRYRVQRTRRLAVQALEAFIQLREKQLSGAAREELEEIVAMLRSFEHSNDAP